MTGIYFKGAFTEGSVEMVLLSQMNTFRHCFLIMAKLHGNGARPYCEQVFTVFAQR